jgi:hypothetical protein
MATVHHDIQTALAPLVQRIAAFAELEPDWDSYGAAPPTSEALESATRCLRVLVAAVAPEVGDKAMPFWVAPLPTGGVHVEWRGSRSALEVEIGPQGQLGFLLQEDEGANAVYEEGDDASLSDIHIRLRQVVVDWLNDRAC